MAGVMPSQLSLAPDMVPKDLFMATLFQSYLTHPNKIAIRDLNSKTEARDERLLRDILRLRDEMLARLSHSTVSNLL